MADLNGVDYKPTYCYSNWPVIASVIPDPIRDLIDSRKRGWEGHLGDLGARIVETQVEIYREAQEEARARHSSGSGGGSSSGQPLSLLEQSALTIIESFSGSEEDIHAITSIPAPLARKAIWGSESLPYTAFRLLRRRTLSASSAPGLEDAGDLASTCDIDEWILANERSLRDAQRDHWKYGLVEWENDAPSVFHDSDSELKSGTHIRILNRAANMSGYAFLDELRVPSIGTLATMEAYRMAFAKITSGLLDGLDWANVFVAGGIVLSTLLCIDDSPVAMEKHTQSDIDVYIYGLGPREANEKIKHIFEVWKQNLPEHARDKTMVVRNSRTITFFSEYPIKRVQIVLKLVKDPREVLLNFDLDICSMGFDGSLLWLLPRAARALETGYNVFTMNIVEGHYLGERRASQESRVFKYADKGYGIRILPSYLDSLSPHVDENQPKAHFGRKAFIRPNDIISRANRAVVWTQRAIHTYIQHGYGSSSRHGYKPNELDAHGRLEFTHAMFEERSIVNSEPAHRS